jgi:hypothetical protein
MVSSQLVVTVIPMVYIVIALGVKPNWIFGNADFLRLAVRGSGAGLPGLLLARLMPMVSARTPLMN